MNTEIDSGLLRAILVGLSLFFIFITMSILSFYVNNKGIRVKRAKSKINHGYPWEPWVLKADKKIKVRDYSEAYYALHRALLLIESYLTEYEQVADINEKEVWISVREEIKAKLNMLP
jgi:hypothetical protein